jgi:hypothetical protein
VAAFNLYPSARVGELDDIGSSEGEAKLLTISAVLLLDDLGDAASLAPLNFNGGIHRAEQRRAPASTGLAVLLDHDRRWLVRIDVEGIVACAHHLFEVVADQPVVLDQVTDFPRREGVEIANEDQRSTGSVVFGVQRFDLREDLPEGLVEA